MVIPRLAPACVAAVLVVLLASAASPACGASGTMLGSDTLTRIARDWVVEHFPGELDAATVEPLGPPRELALPPGDVNLSLTLQSGSIAAGTLIVLVEAQVTDARGTRLTRSVTVGFRFNALQETVVAVRELTRRMVVGPADVRLERRTQGRVPPGTVRDLREAIGKEVVRPVAPGEALTAQSLSAPLIIRRGNAVALVLEGPNFKIVARGIAAEDGALGQSIRVVNQSSRREMVGRVEDDRTVRIPF